MTDYDNFFYVKKNSDDDPLKQTAIPRTIVPGSLVQIDIFINQSFWTNVEYLDQNRNATTRAFGDGYSFIVLVTTVNYEKGIVEGWVGEDLLRFSRKFKIIELSNANI